MSKNMKVVLIILGCVLLLCTGIAGAGFYWFSTSGRQMLEQVKNDSKKVIEEGAVYGRSVDQNACLTESIKRVSADSSITNTMSATFFLTACLKTGKPTPGFCDGVPAQSEILKTSEWAIKKCVAAGSPGQGCPQLMQVVIRHCGKGVER